jgi:hypothetical protein
MPATGLELGSLESLARSIARAVLVSAPLSELAPKCPDFLKSCRYIPQNRCDSDDLGVVVAEGQDRELDRDTPAVFSQRRYRQDLAGAKTRASAPHRCRKALPVACPQIIGNDDVEALPKRLGFGKTEDPFRAAVQEADHALGIGKDDRVRRFADECQAETVYIDRRLIISSPIRLSRRLGSTQELCRQ